MECKALFTPYTLCPSDPSHHANFQKLQALHRARQDKVKSRMAAVDRAEPDFEERVAQTQIWFGKAREELRTAQGGLDEHK